MSWTIEKIREHRQEELAGITSDRTGRPVVVFLALMAVGLLVGAIYMAVKVPEIEHWPSTTGRVVESRVLERDTVQVGRKPSAYDTRIGYDYEVDGVRYTGYAVSFGHVVTNDLEQMKQIVSKYPVGSSVDVYYDPADPDRAVLERGDNLLPHVMLAGSLMAGSMAMLFWYGIRRTRRVNLEALERSIAHLAIRTALEASEVPDRAWPEPIQPGEEGRIEDEDQAVLVARALRAWLPRDPAEARSFFDVMVVPALRDVFEEPATHTPPRVGQEIRRR